MMCLRTLLAAACGLAFALPLFAQPAAAPKLPEPIQPPVAQPVLDALAQPASGPIVWFTADYLMWWTKSQPFSQPLITLGSSADDVPGALDQPNTTVLFGNERVRYGVQSGLRFGLGAWFTADRVYGIETSFFVLAQRSRGVAFASDGVSDAAYGQPVINPSTGEEAYSTSLQGLISGSIWAKVSTQTTGWEVNVLRNLTRTEVAELNLLFGFRQLSISETLRVESDITQLGDCILSFNGAATELGDHIITRDRFAASTNFYGPQFGTKWDWSAGPFGVNLIAKLGMGVSQQVLRISGDTTWVPANGDPTTTVHGGILAQSTNIGSHSRNRFAVLPELNLNASYEFAPGARFVFGYTFLYLSSALRPGQSVDRTVDPARVPSDQNFGQTPTTDRPGVTLRDAGFWAQGLNFGVSIKY